MAQVRTNRKAWKFILFSILTLGIYMLIAMIHIVKELNIVAVKDGKKTMHYLVVMLLTPITLGIYPLIWGHKFSARIGEQLQARGIDHKFGAGTYWGWNVLGMLIGVGPIIYLCKMLKAVNLINADYNAKGE